MHTSYKLKCKHKKTYSKNSIAVKKEHVQYTVQSTYNFTHVWHFFAWATRDCDTCHAGLQRGPCKLLGVGHARGISYCLPHVAIPLL